MGESKQRVDECVAAVRGHWTGTPKLGIILGTGLGSLSEQIEAEAVVPYADLPGMPEPTLDAHEGRLVLGTLAGKPVAAMDGRCHLYEGFSPLDVTFSTRVLCGLGADVLVVSNVAGGLNPLYNLGDIVLISDHINLMAVNPLVGVYAAVVGPCLETRAEYRYLRIIGADLVGMSTVPEVIVAVHAGMKTLGISVVSDRCLPDALQPVNIEEIIRAGQEAEPKLKVILMDVIQKL